MSQGAETIGPDQEFEASDLVVYRNRLPFDVCRGLHHHILSQRYRKIIHTLIGRDCVVPEPIADAVPYVPFLDGCNIIITKRYHPGENSGAYVEHTDPEEYANGPLVMCSTGGRAVLTVMRSEHDPMAIDCTPNTIVVVHDNPGHLVTPPLDGEIRTFMFGGHDTTLSGAFEDIK